MAPQHPFKKYSSLTISGFFLGIFYGSKHYTFCVAKISDYIFPLFGWMILLKSSQIWNSALSWIKVCKFGFKMHVLGKCRISEMQIFIPVNNSSCDMCKYLPQLVLVILKQIGSSHLTYNINILLIYRWFEFVATD